MRVGSVHGLMSACLSPCWWEEQERRATVKAQLARGDLACGANLTRRSLGTAAQQRKRGWLPGEYEVAFIEIHRLKLKIAKSTVKRLKSTV